MCGANARGYCPQYSIRSTPSMRRVPFVAWRTAMLSPRISFRVRVAVNPMPLRLGFTTPRFCAAVLLRLITWPAAAAAAAVQQGFIEIHSPKLLAGASEGGSEVFITDYFGQPACLAQSPQLYKQMTAACGGFERVMEVGKQDKRMVLSSRVLRPEEGSWGLAVSFLIGTALVGLRASPSGCRFECRRVKGCVFATLVLDCSRKGVCSAHASASFALKCARGWAFYFSIHTRQNKRRVCTTPSDPGLSVGITHTRQTKLSRTKRLKYRSTRRLSSVPSLSIFFFSTPCRVFFCDGRLRWARCLGRRSPGRTDTCANSRGLTSRWSSRSTTTRYGSVSGQEIGKAT